MNTKKQGRRCYENQKLELKYFFALVSILDERRHDSLV